MYALVVHMCFNLVICLRVFWGTNQYDDLPAPCNAPAEAYQILGDEFGCSNSYMEIFRLFNIDTMCEHIMEASSIFSFGYYFTYLSIFVLLSKNLMIVLHFFNIKDNAGQAFWTSRGSN